MEILYVNKVKDVARQFGLTSKAFRSDPAEVLSGTATALMSSEAVLDRPNMNTAVLFAIAAQDGVLAAQNGLKGSLPVESYEYYRLHAVNHLGVVTNQNVEAYSADSIHYIKSHYSRKASQDLLEEASHWGPGSRLHSVRQNLAIVPASELNYTVLALDKTSVQMGMDIGTRGKMMFLDGRNFLVTDRNGESFEHEYGHSQGVGIPGFRGRVFHAVEEALVESVVKKPRSYAEYRKTLAAVDFMGGREAGRMLRGAYRQGGEVSNDLMRFLISHGGLESLLRLGWMGNPNLGMHSISPSEVHDYIVDNLAIPGGARIYLAKAQPSIGFSGRRFGPADFS